MENDVLTPGLMSCYCFQTPKHVMYLRPWSIKFAVSLLIDYSLSDLNRTSSFLILNLAISGCNNFI